MLFRNRCYLNGKRKGKRNRNYSTGTQRVSSSRRRGMAIWDGRKCSLSSRRYTVKGLSQVKNREKMNYYRERRNPNSILYSENRFSNCPGRDGRRNPLQKIRDGRCSVKRKRNSSSIKRGKRKAGLGKNLRKAHLFLLPSQVLKERGIY